jgi:hypothetical protein
VQVPCRALHQCTAKGAVWANPSAPRSRITRTRPAQAMPELGRGPDAGSCSHLVIDPTNILGGRGDYGRATPSVRHPRHRRILILIDAPQVLEFSGVCLPAPLHGRRRLSHLAAARMVGLHAAERQPKIGVAHHVRQHLNFRSRSDLLADNIDEDEHRVSKINAACFPRRSRVGRSHHRGTVL